MGKRSSLNGLSSPGWLGRQVIRLCLHDGDFLHATDPERALAVMKPGGSIILHEYDYNHPDVDPQDFPADVVEHWNRSMREPQCHRIPYSPKARYSACSKTKASKTSPSRISRKTSNP